MLPAQREDKVTQGDISWITFSSHAMTHTSDVSYAAQTAVDGNCENRSEAKTLRFCYCTTKCIRAGWRRESSEVVVLKALEGVADEWQAHFGCIIITRLTICRSGRSCSLEVRSIIGLINLISRKVGGVDVRAELGLEWGSDSAKSIELNSTEEFVVLNLICTSTAKTILGVANKTKRED
jgi:hypothetical protein